MNLSDFDPLFLIIPALTQTTACLLGCFIHTGKPALFFSKFSAELCKNVRVLSNAAFRVGIELGKPYINCNLSASGFLRGCDLIHAEGDFVSAGCCQ